MMMIIWSHCETFCFTNSWMFNPRTHSRTQVGLLLATRCYIKIYGVV